MFRAASAIAAMLFATSASAGAESMNYPETHKGDVVETQFGEAIADPYRWLENDVRTDPAVANWVKRENEVTNGYLATLPQRAWFAEHIRSLMDYERFGLPHKAGKRYFYTRNSGLQNQAQLFVREGIDGAPRLLLDPNAWAKDGATALDAWVPSDKGRYLAYSVQDGGSDWRVLKVLDVATGKVMADALHWAKFTGMAWVGEQGFLYSRFPKPAEGAEFQSRNFNQAVYFHRIGTSQDADELVFATPDQPEVGHGAEVTNGGRYAVITSGKGTDARWEVRVIDLAHRKATGWKTRTLVSGFDHKWQPVDAIGKRLWFVTDKDAPRGKLMAVDLSGANPAWSDVVPQRDETLEQASIVGDKLILSYLKDASTRAEVYDLGGQHAQVLTLNGIGTASGFIGKPGDPETFYAFTSFNQPALIRRLNLHSGATSVFATPRLTFNPDDYAVEQRFFPSRDGTRVPLFLVRKKALVGKAVPTLLYGYGGFDISLTPSFSAPRMAWLEAGGAFAMANLRGGGEYGKAWHDAGRLANKQNVFDDFIAAGEYLIKEGVTPRDGLSIQGGSNGGLLVGAVTNQRPDLFAAANAAVGVMDMLRFDRFTAGRYWTDDYGFPNREADFKVLRAYSPYHNIRSGADYPAVLVTTADTDDRVVPGHSFKYISALQAAQTGAKPHLIRIETRAGHGAGKPTDKIVAENADVLAFLARWSGLAVSE
ncbi:MAG: S9 family peptidase [Sphingomonadales bacterium]|nr:S9 family peptidase [Sphingomonadales bacterium]